jgi:hypothetical protein
MRITDIKAWNVYLVKSNETDPPKIKYAVIAHVSETPTCFLINSKLTDWMRRHRDLLICDPLISVTEHSFLSHDSYVDCQRVFHFFDWEITKWLGPLSEQAKIDILDAVHRCPTLERKYKKLILGHEGYPGY